MSAIVILLLASTSIAAGFLIAYLWSVRDGQFDDEYGPPRRILFPDQTATPEKDEETEKQQQPN